MNKILVIDDIEENLLLIKKILSKKMPENSVLLANSGMQGIDIAMKEVPDTILLDIFMPKIDGYEVCRSLKKSRKTKHIPILMVSAYGDDAAVRIKGLNAGADAFISKPYNIAELVALVKVMLRIKNDEDLLREQNLKLKTNVSKLREAKKVQKDNLIKIQNYQEKLKKLNSELLLTEEKERKTIAGFLHDGIGQTLSIAHIQLTSLQNKEIDETIKKTISDSSNLIDSAIKETRLLTYDLSPPILYELGLLPAIKWKLNQVKIESGISIKFINAAKSINLNANSSILAYRIFCELLINIEKHAEASMIIVEIAKVNKMYEISVTDNGKGIDNGTTNKNGLHEGYGLFSINERIESINGSFVLKSNKGEGTKAIIKIPI